MFGFHMWDLLIVLIIALIIFGPRKLPEIGGAIGKSVREFQKASTGIEEQKNAPEQQALPPTSARQQEPPTSATAAEPEGLAPETREQHTSSTER